MGEEHSSSLILQIERESQPGNNEWIYRELRVYFKDHQRPSHTAFRRGNNIPLNKLGERFAFVPLNVDGMLDQLNVDAVIEIDGGPVINEPIVLEHTTRNTMGFTLTGIPSVDKDRMKPDMSQESIMILSGGDFVGPLQAGFTPGQESIHPLGRTLDNKGVRMKFMDMRPPAEVPPLEPLRRV